jgi:branched-subunit amino acid permease
MKPESSTSTLPTKSKVKGFSNGFNALDAEMSQMVHIIIVELVDLLIMASPMEHTLYVMKVIIAARMI